jgi:hypothetical protein
LKENAVIRISQFDEVMKAGAERYIPILCKKRTQFMLYTLKVKISNDTIFSILKP